MIHPIIDEIINGETCIDTAFLTRETKNERQLAESVRNMLRNMLKEDSYVYTIVSECDVLSGDKLVSNIEEMLADMEQLNELRKTNKTW